MRNQPQLITYVDRLTAGTFRDLERLLTSSLARAFGGVHVLPFFDPIDGADAGFDPQRPLAGRHTRALGQPLQCGRD